MNPEFGTAGVVGNARCTLRLSLPFGSGIGTKSTASVTRTWPVGGYGITMLPPARMMSSPSQSSAPYVEPQKPREIWVNEYPLGLSSGFETKEEADLNASKYRTRCVKFVEVIEE